MSAGAPAGVRLAISAALGGTAEQLSGGSFANGAVCAAFVVLFNHINHQNEVKQKQNPEDIPFGGIMFYTDDGVKIYVSLEGENDIIYTINDENIDALTNEIDAYEEYWSQERPCIGCNNAFNDPNYFQNLADKYASNSYSVMAGYGKNGDPYVYGYVNAPWYMYAAAALSMSVEAFAAGYNSGRAYQNYTKSVGSAFQSHYSQTINYGVTGIWGNYFGAKSFDPWW